jgi:hypothetical protein
MQFVELLPNPESITASSTINQDGKFILMAAGPAPFLDYEPLQDELRTLVHNEVSEAGWLRGDLENQVIEYAVKELIPGHLQEVKKRRYEWIERTYRAVKDRLTKEIAYWDHRAEELKAQEQAGRINARLNSEMARRRADDLQGRLQRRLAELDKERRIAPQAPLVIGGALVIPAGLLARLEGKSEEIAGSIRQRKQDAVEKAAMQAVMEREYGLGYKPVDVSAARLGWDIESHIPGSGKLRFIEVKGRVEGATTITVSKNEILAGLNKPDDFILAIVEVEIRDGRAEGRQHSLHREALPARAGFRGDECELCLEGVIGENQINHEFTRISTNKINS